MKPARLAIVVVVGLVLVGGALLFMGTKRSGRISELQKQAESESPFKRADVYLKGTDADKKYVEELFVHAKDAAKEELGGFFSPPPDKQKYFTTLYQAMLDAAREHKKDDFVKSFRGWVVGQGFIDVK